MSYERKVVKLGSNGDPFLYFLYATKCALLHFYSFGYFVFAYLASISMYFYKVFCPFKKKYFRILADFRKKMVNADTKGQLISKCLFGVSKSTKKPVKFL